MIHSSERWAQIESLFLAGLELPPASRSAFLDEHCGTDLELRREIEGLLESAEKPLEILEQPVFAAARELAAGPEVQLIRPGEAISHYEVLSCIGAGGMGQVYLAIDTVLRRRVALKLLNPALAHDERGLRRFEQEARAASSLNHPNILTIYEFGSVAGLQYIASEFVDGWTLRQKLADGPLPPATAVQIAIQIARALDGAHAAGIIHRDIKPENVMIRKDQLVKVLDFGIAKLTLPQSLQQGLPGSLALSLSMSLAGLVIGSARYMSPEQARGLPVDPRSDLFSLGVVLYEMVAGKAPFEGQTVSDVIAEILKGTPRSLCELQPNAPERLQEIVATAMCKEVDGRYASAEAMLADLEDCAAGLPPAAAVPGASGKGSAGIARTPTPWPALAPPAANPPALAPAAKRSPHAALPLWLWMLAALVAVAVVAVLIALHRRGTETANVVSQQSRTLAILPFRNLRQDPSLDYLGFSLSDAIVTELSSISSLTVRPSSWVEPYRNQNEDPRKIAQELNVNTLLTGTYIKDGDDLLITAQLIDTRANRIIWRHSIDVRYDRLLEVQDRVSQEIVKGLELRLSPSQAQSLRADKPANAKAYEDYLRGVDLYSLGDYAAAIAMLERSTSLDPNYAPAWAHLGKAYTTSATLHFGGREEYDKAQAAYEKATVLNPELVEARIYEANMLTDTGRVEQSVPLLRAALLTSPANAELHWELGYAYRFAGMLDASVAECDEARRIDPQVKINSSAINAYLYLGQYDKFLASLPNQDVAYVVFYRGLGQYYEHDLKDAAANFDRAYVLEPSLLPARVGKAISDSMAGQHAAAMSILNQTENEMEARGVSDAESMYKIALAYAVAGDRSASLHALSHTIEGGFFCYQCFINDPLLANERSDPEFERLAKQALQRHDEFRSRFF
jgi:TolB-like protein/tRNA A-37 threonylcarbamoyl transferase component Bud32/Flp pilus assembly protein TadD